MTTIPPDHAALLPHSLLPVHEQQALRDAVTTRDDAEPGMSASRTRALDAVTERLRFKYPERYKAPDPIGEETAAWLKKIINSPTR